MNNDVSGEEAAGRTAQDLPTETEAEGDAPPPQQWSRLLTLVTRRNVMVSVCLLLLCGTLGAYWYVVRDGVSSAPQYTKVYSFVPEKVSKSAPIALSLPEGVSEVDARGALRFSPEITGEWQEEVEEGVMRFVPREPLRVGTYYRAILETDSLSMSGDFLADEDPKIEAVFPGPGTEVHEDSEVSIVFNRPMVPLTTLSTLEGIEVPVTITPETPGRFKWVSTRTLQFIPESTLIPSTDYTIKVGEGFVSVDGLVVAPYEHAFTTRPLRYSYISSGVISYRSPIVVAFNQPVDLNATKRDIEVRTGVGEVVALEVEYGEAFEYDPVSKKRTRTQDTSVIALYQKRDTHGRSRLWDFDTTYSVTVKGATPLRGNRPLAEVKTSIASVPSVIAHVTAQSERTDDARPDLMDPEGTVTVQFYDEVDIEASRFSVKGKKNVVYAERCVRDAEGETVDEGPSCEKEPDRSTLIFSFDEDAFTRNEAFTLTFDKVTTPEGFVVNAEPVRVELRTYPDLVIYSTTPGNNAQAAPLNVLKVCTNTPLRAPGEGGLKEYLTASGYLVAGRWSPSQYVSKAAPYYTCGEGQFETALNYGLHPEQYYQLGIALTDMFGGTERTQVTFTTGVPEEKYTRFHNLQQQYNVTKPERTKLTYAVENLEYVQMHICKMNSETFLRTVSEVPGERTPPRSVGCTVVVEKQISLPARYWVNNYFEVQLADYFPDVRGAYVVTFTNPLYRDHEGIQIFDRTYVHVTNLAVAKKEVERREESWWSVSANSEADRVRDRALTTALNLYWVTDSTTLAPRSGAEVVEYTRGDSASAVVRGNAVVADGNGIARPRSDDNVIGAVVTSGSDSAVVTDWADQLGYAGPAQNASRTYVYTDRPIYRPGHTVHIKGIDRVGFDGTYEITEGEEAAIKVFDPRGEVVFETTRIVSAYGTFETSLTLPAEAPLGSYRIDVLGQSAFFDVEEYVPAAFRLDVTPEKEEYLHGETFALDVDAAYYFGVPVDSATVSYSVSAQDYYFDRYKDEYFNFGGGWYYCYYCGYGDRYLFRGETQLDANGRARIERQIDLTKYLESDEHVTSKLVTVSLTAKDQNGRSVSAQTSFILHAGEFYLGAKTDTYYTSANTPVVMRVKTVDTEGMPRSVRGITRTVHKVTWETFKRQEVDGGFYHRSEKKLTEVAKEQITTDSDGNWRGEVSLAEEGQYEITYRATDARGNEIVTTNNLYISGREALPSPENNNYELDLEVEKSSVTVGERASFLIKSPYPSARALVSLERGTIYSHEVVTLEGGLYRYEFPVTSAHAPNVYASVVLLSPLPEVKYGMVRFDVGVDEKKINVEVSTSKQQYLPGEEVTLTVKTTDAVGKPVPAEVSLAVADLSVLALKGNPKKNPTLFFYDGFPLSVSTASNVKNILHEVDIPLGTKGGSGAMPDDLATKKRGLFKDTAFWKADVETALDGTATVTFTLPDNLTTWQIESLAVTKDTKLGVAYREFGTKKDLMAVPLRPRFVVPGDRFSLGATVFNQTDERRTIKVALSSDTLTFTEDSSDDITLAAGDSKSVYFEVEAPRSMRAGEHTFTFTASSLDDVDSVEQRVPITQNTTYETVATAHFTKDDASTEYVYVPREVEAGEGGLTINANATLAVFMQDAIGYMVTYPYGCSEQLASALSTIAIVKRALEVPQVEGELTTLTYEGITYTIDEVIQDGLSQIEKAQTPGGGFAYYAGMRPDFMLTVHVARALNELKKSGYPVRDDIMVRARAFIESEGRRLYAENPQSTREMLISAELTLRSIDPKKETAFTSVIQSFIKDDAYLRETIGSTALAELAILTAEGYGWFESREVYSALVNRIDIDGRGAYLASRGARNSDLFETSVKNTALLLSAFTSREDEHEMLGNTLRWILASRDSRGAWGSTHNTQVVVSALVDYLTWQHETESRFTLRGIINGVEKFTHEFMPSNVFETFTYRVGIDELPRETMIPVTLTRTQKEEKQNLYYDMSLRYFLPAASLPPRDEGITVTRGLYAYSDTLYKKEIKEARVGDIVRGRVTVTIPAAYRQVAIEDIIPAGFELVNFNLATEDQTLDDAPEDSEEEYWNFDEYDYEAYENATQPSTMLGAVWGALSNVFGSSQAALVATNDLGGTGRRDRDVRELRPTHAETHDDRLFLYSEYLEPGVYEYRYYLRALVPGTFQHLPARAEELYFPEVFGRTSGDTITITQAE